MAKPKRGTNAKRIENWRGTCPLCERKRVKILWSAVKDGETLRICKKCSVKSGDAA